MQPMQMLCGEGLQPTILQALGIEGRGPVLAITILLTQLHHVMKVIYCFVFPVHAFINNVNF